MPTAQLIIILLFAALALSIVVTALEKAHQRVIEHRRGRKVSKSWTWTDGTVLHEFDEPVQ
jgi:hypothetical protein